MRRAATLLGASVVFLAPAAFGATWASGTTPHLGQVFAIDATGEPNWLYGAEDVLGDGVTTFTPAEQALDLRTAYAKATPTQLWTRVYVSSAAAADTTLTVFVFIDSDRNAATGGGTNSTTLSPAFTTEKSPGGYEYVLGVLGNGTIANVWQWQTTPSPNYVVVTVTPAQAVAEVGADVDPIRIGPASHAYVQGRIDLGIVGLTQACDANLYVRSARSSGASDLDMTYTTSCVPATTNGVPTIVLQPGCTSNAQCPQNGVCQNGTCIVAQPCATAADCPANYTCTTDGRCVPVGGGTCSTIADCNGLACVSGKCVACTQGGSECGAGYQCAPNGTCVAGGGGDGGTTGSGEVEGGALHCNIGPTPKSAAGLGILAALLGVLFARRKNG